VSTYAIAGDICQIMSNYIAVICIRAPWIVDVNVTVVMGETCCLCRKSVL